MPEESLNVVLKVESVETCTLYEAALGEKIHRRVVLTATLFALFVGEMSTGQGGTKI